MATQPIRLDSELTAGSGIVTAAWNRTTKRFVPAEIDLSGLATESYVNTAIAALVDTAPGALDTLNELAAALGDDANFASTVTTALASKMTQTQADARYLQLSGGTLTGGLLGTSASMTGALTTNSGGAKGVLGGFPGVESVIASLHLGITTPSSSNYVLAGSDSDTFLNAVGSLYFRLNNSTKGELSVNGFNFGVTSRFSHTGHASDATAGAMILGKASSAPLATNDFLRLNEYNSDTALFRVDKAGNVIVTSLMSPLDIRRGINLNWTGSFTPAINGTDTDLAASLGHPSTSWSAVYANNLFARSAIHVAGVQVVSAQQAAIADHASDATVNAILAAMRAHGLIAT